MKSSGARNTLLDFFADFAETDASFLLHDDGFRVRLFTYREVAGKARAFALRLRESGIARDEKIVLYGENRPEWIIALWGALLGGVIVVPIDYRSSPEFLARVAEIVKAKAILAGDEVETAADPEGVPVWPLSSLDVPPAPAFTPESIARDQVAEIIFTSGATAEPKGVVITHRNVLANIVPVEGEVRKYRKYSRPFAPIRFLNLLPLSHMFGQAMATFIPPMLPGVVVFLRGYNPAEITRQIHTRRISVLVCVPQILQVLREYVLQRYPELENAVDKPGRWWQRWWRHRKIHSLFGWKFWSFIVGAAPLPPDLEAFWSKLGFLVIQGYGLTETAPIVTLNHPFHARQGSVGKPIGGIEVKIAEDGEILVRGENVTMGYFNSPEETARAFADGWFHTGDIGRLDESGRLAILGRKKEMIVTPEGLNVFPEDVEAVLNQTEGVKESAVVGQDRVHAVLILEPDADAEAIVRAANARLADHQKIRDYSLWPYERFPRTEGTNKLKRREIAAGARPPKRDTKYDPSTPLDTLTSLERVELMVSLDVDEAAAQKASTVAELQQLRDSAPARKAEEPAELPSWNRSPIPRIVRRAALPGFLLPLTRRYAHLQVEGLDRLENARPPVIFAANHQSYLDVPAILAALPVRWRYRVAPAMRKEFFDAHFHPKRYSRKERFTNSLNYYLAAGLFNAFPLPQREAGALDTMRYMGDLASQGWCVLIFPEGRMTDDGSLSPFQPGVGMLASRLNVPVVPIRLTGLDRVLHHTWRRAKPGPVTIAFGGPIALAGHDYAALARQVADAVRRL